MAVPFWTVTMVLATALPPDAAAKLSRWRAEKDEEMRAPFSPLAREPARRLDPGHNVLGSAPSDSLRFDRPGVPASCVDFVVENGLVQVVPLVPVVEIDGEPAAPGPLRWGGRVGVGPLTLALVGGPRAPQLSVNDASLPSMLGYRGLRYLPIDGRYRVPATFERAASGRTLSLTTSTGGERVLPLRGKLRFRIDGRDLALDAFGMGDRPDDLFVIFKDATNGRQSYGSGRFLWVDRPVDGKTVVDFNFAWNPLCAYSHAFNCPLAPPENRLPVPIPAGEATYFPE